MVGCEFKGPQGRMVRVALAAVCAGAGLSACASVTPAPIGLASASSGQGGGYAAPAGQGRYAQGPAQKGPRYKIGAPYQAGGVWYVPAEQPSYDEVGIASWYGDEFNGKPTANGELFDMNGISAAHATLPMPSIVEVTNLENGKTLQVRLNDRGPFHPGRIIDLSRGAAQQLGFFNKGTAQVRVRFIRVAPLPGGGEQTSLALNRMQTILPPAPPSFAPSTDAPASYAPVAATPTAVSEPVQSIAGGFAVQAGAFSDRANADRVAARLASAGRTLVSPLDRGGSRLYRVTVGSWPNADDAGAARQKVVALGFAEARVVAGS